MKNDQESVTNYGSVAYFRFCPVPSDYCGSSKCSGLEFVTVEILIWEQRAFKLHHGNGTDIDLGTVFLWFRVK